MGRVIILISLNYLNGIYIFPIFRTYSIAYISKILKIYFSLNLLSHKYNVNNIENFYEGENYLIKVSLCIDKNSLKYYNNQYLNYLVFSSQDKNI